MKTPPVGFTLSDHTIDAIGDPSDTDIIKGADFHLISVMTTALGKKDLYTHLHAQRVSVYARRLAHRLGSRKEDVKQIALGGMLHDVGKLALSDQLFSPQHVELTDELWDEVYTHPLIGAAIIENIYGKGVINDTVLYHHERLDGTGYPFGLCDGQIPLGARIVSTADCFDAITSDRPYQKRKSPDQAFRILEDMAHCALDPELVALLIEDVIELGMA